MLSPVKATLKRLLYLFRNFGLCFCKKLIFRVLQLCFVTVFGHISSLSICVCYQSLLLNFNVFKPYNSIGACWNAYEFIWLINRLTYCIGVSLCFHSLNFIWLFVSICNRVFFSVCHHVLLILEFLLHSVLDFYYGLIGIRWKFA